MATARRLAVAAVTAAATLVLGASPAAAHAELEGTDPGPGSVLDAAPEAVTLDFNEEVELSLGGVRLFDADGNSIDVGAPERVSGDASKIRTALPSLENGSYVVAWQVFSADSHPARGAFTFQIGQGRGADTRSLVADLRGGSQTNGTSEAALTAARFVAYAGLALLLGGLVFVAWAWPAGGQHTATRRLLWTGLALAFLGALAAFALQGPYVTGQTVAQAFDTDLWDGVARTRFGRSTLARAALLAVGGGALLLQLRRCRTAVWRGSLVGLVLATATTVAFAGHAGVERLPVLGLVADVAHVGAMSVWLGGLAVAGLVALRVPSPVPAPARSVGAASAVDIDSAELADGSPELGDGSPDRLDAVTAVTMRRFSLSARIAVAVLVVSGVAQAWRLVGAIEPLVDTNYGRTLLVKTAIVAAMVVAAAFSNRALSRRQGKTLRQSVRDELAFGIGVLAVTAVLVGTAPARAVTGEPFSVSVVKDSLIADVTIDPAVAGRPNEMHMLFTPPGGSLERLQGVDVRFTLPDRDIGPLEIRVDTAGPNHWVASGFELPFAGDWELEMLVRVSDFEQVRLTSTVPIS